MHYIDKSNFNDLIVYNIGEEKCAPGHAFGPYVRSSYLIHYILSGKGFFESGANKYTLEKGNAFLICPGQLTYYHADLDNPWHYVWIDFNGVIVPELLKKIGISSENPIFYQKYADEEIDGIFSELLSENYNNIKITGLSFLLFDSFIKKSLNALNDKKYSINELYVNTIKEYVNNNYFNDVKIDDLSKQLNLNRSHLSRIFKSSTGSSPQNYLINFRMLRACEYLENPDLKISDCARSVGYNDYSAFCKIFKKIIGITPAEYRNS